MTKEYQPKVTASLWNSVEEFLESGLTRTHKVEDLNTDHFIYFSILLRKFHEAPFKEADKLVQGDTVVAVATPKPKTMFFDTECHLCEQVIKKEKIHFEVEGSKSLIYLCKNCFFGLPFEED